MTYVAAGNVYVDAGKNQGVDASARAVVTRGGQALTTLRLEAASSKSSSWLADSSIQVIRVGDLVRISVASPVSGAPVTDTTKRPSPSTILTSSYQRLEVAAERASFEVQGRVGAQVFAMGFDDPALGSYMFKTTNLCPCSSNMQSSPIGANISSRR